MKGKSFSRREMDSLAEKAWELLDHLTFKELHSGEQRLMEQISEIFSPLQKEDYDRYMGGVAELLAMRMEALRTLECRGKAFSQDKSRVENFGCPDTRARCCDTCIYYGHPNPLQCFNPRRRKSVNPAGGCGLYRRGISVERMLLLVLGYDGPTLASWKDYLDFLASLGIRKKDLTRSGKELIPQEREERQVS